MPIGVAVEAFLVSQFVAAAAMLLLAAWLLWLNVRSAVNRSFAAFLVFRACVIIANRLKGLAEDAGDAREAMLWEGIREYYFLALAPTLLYFWVAYAKPRRQALWKAIIVAGALLVEVLYLLDHSLNFRSTPSGLVHLGPLSPLGLPMSQVVMGLVGLWILREALQASQVPRGKAAFPVALGLLLGPVLDVSIVVGLVLRLGPDAPLAVYAPSPLVTVFHVIFFLALAPALIGLAWMARIAARDPAFRSKAQVLGALAVLLAASGLYVGWNVRAGANWLPGLFIIGLWRILLPALVAYSLVRHRLFGIEIRLQWTLVRATMAFFFLGVFFVAAQLAQNYLSEAYGWSLGGIAAGLLLFTVSPLQHAAERFAQTVMPHARPVAVMTRPERLDLFRHQAALVWSDGTMGRKERAILDGLRQRLGMSYEEAAHLEAEAASFPGPTSRVAEGGVPSVPR